MVGWFKMSQHNEINDDSGEERVENRFLKLYPDYDYSVKSSSKEKDVRKKKKMKTMYWHILKIQSIESVIGVRYVGFQLRNRLSDYNSLGPHVCVFMSNPFNAKNNCTQSDAKFSNHKDLVVHVKHDHHKTIVKCQKYGEEFIHEIDFITQEKNMKKKWESAHRKSHPDEYCTQSRIDRFKTRFNDKL